MRRTLPGERTANERASKLHAGQTKVDNRSGNTEQASDQAAGEQKGCRPTARPTTPSCQSGPRPADRAPTRRRPELARRAAPDPAKPRRTSRRPSRRPAASRSRHCDSESARQGAATRQRHLERQLSTAPSQRAPALRQRTAGRSRTKPAVCLGTRSARARAPSCIRAPTLSPRFANRDRSHREASCDAVINLECTRSRPLRSTERIFPSPQGVRMKISVRFADANLNPHALWGRAKCLEKFGVSNGGLKAPSGPSPPSPVPGGSQSRTSRRQRRKHDVHRSH